MTYDQTVIFSLFGAVFLLLLWGRFRYDLVALTALIAGVILGVVPKDIAFSGFGHPATIIVAFVLVVTAGLVRSGAVYLITQKFVDTTRSLPSHIAFMGVIGGVLSAFMNNVAALALLLPVDVQTAQKAKRAIGLSLMPLSFATILGGMATLVGTPPNIIISQYRETYTGTSFNFFDFSFVGRAVKLLGIGFIAFIGNRLVKLRQEAGDEIKLIDLKNYLFEVRVKKDSKAIGKRLSEIKKVAGPETEVLGIVNESGAVSKVSMVTKFAHNQVLVIKTSPDDISRLQSDLDLEISEDLNTIKESDLEEIEVMVTASSRLIGRKQEFLKRLASEDLALLGLWRQGAKFRTRLSREIFRVGDVLLLGVRSIDEEGVKERIKHLGLMPLMQREMQVIPSRSRLLKSIIFFVTFLLLAAFNVINIVIAFLLCVLAFIGVKVLNGNLYRSIEWPVIVMLAAMIPIGQALETTGISNNIAMFISGYTEALPVYMIILLILVVTMFVSDIINNAATAIIMAPIAANIASQLGAPVEPFLMAVAVGASCAFLSPIGHQCNTLVMAPGGYKFGDYWRLGLPLEIVIAAISVPMIMYVWF